MTCDYCGCASAQRACDGVNSPSISYYLPCGKVFVKQSFFFSTSKMEKRSITAPLLMDCLTRLAGCTWLTTIGLPIVIIKKSA